MANPTTQDFRSGIRKILPNFDGTFNNAYSGGDKPNASAAITAVLATLITAGPAPLGVMFDASETTQVGNPNPKEFLSYQIDYGDPGSVLENRPGVDANQSNGFIGRHVYNTPGLYTATVTVTDRFGNTDSATVDITVEDPDVYYTDTYIMAEDGNFTGAPSPSGAGVGNNLTTTAELDSLFAAMSATSPPTRILMKGGVSSVVLDGQQLDPRNRDNYLMLGSWGTGKASLVMDSIKDDYLFFGDMQKFVVDNVTIVGNYNPTDGTGNWVGAFFALANSNLNLTHRCNLSGLGLNQYYAGTDPLTDYHNMTYDCSISDWADYGRLDAGGEFGCVAGCSIKQNPATVTLDGTKGIGSPDHGPMRIARPARFNIQDNDLFNNAGWSSGGLAHQPCIRIGTSATPVNTVVSDNICEGGYNNMELVVANSGVTANGATSLIIERNKFKATANTETAFTTCYGGYVFRNNLMIKSDNGGPPLGTGSYSAGIMAYSVAINDPSNLSAVSKIYNNTLISTATTVNVVDQLSFVRVNTVFTQFDLKNNIVYIASTDPAQSGGLFKMRHAGGMANVSEDNNILYAPDITTFVDDNGSFQTLAAWRTASSQGASSSTADPLFVDPANEDGALQTTSPARNSGLVLDGLIKDLNQVNRDSQPDVGAVEYV
ncbi:hypothetical protein FLL45_01595 [Aliikangiella marina]|uniref:PKD domain-containing protein n=1 Tax=Aliikangiella marina TaxID=1712262 RepID=A0A545THQ0_9GAMM|nr:PKD domain-containing protein [Aliikangiella marina]TQV76681.1 hypothetical protein FLL45_01595 [Aliikangiella marina]